MRKEARSGKPVSRVLIVLGALIALAMVPAASSAVTIEIGGDVYKDKCAPCHADISQTEDFAVTFTHGNHINSACSSCHTEFPHRPQGVLRPTMKDCFNCHGLKHGSQGAMATGECYDVLGRFGQPGRSAGRLAFPNDVAVTADGSRLYVADTGNHRVQA
ncbi:MAG: hypothetical protein ACYCX5_12385, partial [Coriobacteriia bacterium]